MSSWVTEQKNQWELKQICGMGKRRCLCVSPSANWLSLLFESTMKRCLGGDCDSVISEPFEFISNYELHSRLINKMHQINPNTFTFFKKLLIWETEWKREKDEEMFPSAVSLPKWLQFEFGPGRSQEPGIPCGSPHVCGRSPHNWAICCLF